MEGKVNLGAQQSHCCVREPVHGVSPPGNVTHATDATAQQPPKAPTAATHEDFAARLRALAPKRLSNRQRKDIYCTVLRQVEDNPAAQAIIEQIGVGNTPGNAYYLGYGIILSPRGVQTTLGLRTWPPELATRLLSESDFSPEHFPYRDFFTQRAKAECSIAERITEICTDLEQAFISARDEEGTCG